MIKWISTLIAVFLLFNLGAQAPNLGTTSSFALFTAAGAFNVTGASVVTGDVGTNVGAFNAFPPGILIGSQHVANPTSAQAATDVATAYNDLFSLTCGTVIGVGLGGGQTLTPDIYCIGAAATLNGNLILNGTGDPGGIFVIQIDGALSTTVNSTVTLVNVSLCNVFWQINGAVGLGSNSVFQGTMLVAGAISMDSGASLFGRGLSTQGAISLSDNVVTRPDSPTPSVITADGAVSFCAGDSVGLSGNVNGTWNTGSTAASIVVYAAGDYFVTNTNSCGSTESNHIIVTIGGQPTPSVISGPNVVCVGESIILTGNNGGTWNTGATTASITVSTAGDYFVTNTCGGSSVESNHITVTVDPQPMASTIVEGGPTTFCVGGKVVLSGNTGGTWSTGSTSSSIVITTSGDYFVTNTNSCGTVVSNHIIVKVIPPKEVIHITAGGPTMFCIGGSVVLFGNTNGVWSTGATTVAITVTTSGDYYVTNSDECGDHTSNHIVVVVDNPPVASKITASDTVSCIGNNIGISGNVGGVWNTGESTPDIIVTKTGKYFVTNSNSCGIKISNIINVKINGRAPSCIIKGNNVICEGGSTTLCAPSGFTYLWSTGETGRCITVNKTGYYTVAVNNGGCISSCGRIVVPAEPICVITGSSEIYKGQSTTFCAPVGHSYKWSTGETTRCITTGIGGEYGVTITKNGCSATCSTVLKVNDKVICIITGDTVICPGSIQTICAAHVPGNTYYWNTMGLTTRCIEINCEGKYVVTVTNSGLSSVCTLVVKNETPSPCTEIRELGGFEPRTMGFEIRNYPNPFTNQSIIDFKDSEDGHVVIDLFNLAGRKMLTLFDEDIKRGLLYRVRIDGSKLGYGTYFYIVKYGNNTLVKKLIKQ